MLLPLHIIIAIGSVLFAGVTSFFPSKTKLNFTYLLVALTFLTGTVLVLQKPSHMVSTCITGLIYIGVVLVEIILARFKIAKLKKE